MQMAAAVAVDGEELSPDGEEPSPDRRRTTRNDDACAQSKTVLQDLLYGRAGRLSDWLCAPIKAHTPFYLFNAGEGGDIRTALDGAVVCLRAGPGRLGTVKCP